MNGLINLLHRFRIQLRINLQNEFILYIIVPESMDTTNTMLSETDVSLLERAIAVYGHIVHFDQLRKLFGNERSDSEIRQKVARLARKGWLVRIKKGLYVIVSDITSLAESNISLLRISNALNAESYITLSSALFYYGLVDQLMTTIEAITTQRARQFKFQGFTFAFFKVQSQSYFGFSEKRVEGKLVRIAELEKVVLDYFYLKKDTYSLNLLWEKLTDNQDEFDFDKVQDYALRCNLRLRRATGFFLNQLGIESGKLYESVKAHGGYSRLTADSEDFNAKWRLYYDHRVIE